MCPDPTPDPAALRFAAERKALEACRSVLNLLSYRLVWDKIDRLTACKSTVDEVIAQADAAIAQSVERIVLGEGHGIGKGVTEDGGFRWVGLTAEPGSAEPITLQHIDTDRIEDGHVKYPEKRRKFRLVLEVIEAAALSRRAEGGERAT